MLAKRPPARSLLLSKFLSFQLYTSNHLELLALAVIILSTRPPLHCCFPKHQGEGLKRLRPQSIPSKSAIAPSIPACGSVPIRLAGLSHKPTTKETLAQLLQAEVFGTYTVTTVSTRDGTPWGGERLSHLHILLQASMPFQTLGHNMSLTSFLSATKSMFRGPY